MPQPHAPAPLPGSLRDGPLSGRFGRQISGQFSRRLGRIRLGRIRLGRITGIAALVAAAGMMPAQEAGGGARAIGISSATSPASASTARPAEPSPLRWTPLDQRVVVAPGATEAHLVFAVFNPLPRPVFLGEVTTTCGCSLRIQRSASVAPGATGTVVLSVAVGERQGAVASTVMVAHDAVAHGVDSMRFVLVIPTRPIASPAFVHWMTGSVPRLRPSRLRLDPASPYTLTGEVETTGPFTARLRREHGEWSVEITPLSTTSAVQGEIRVMTQVDGVAGTPVLIIARVVEPAGGPAPATASAQSPMPGPTQP